VLEAIHLVRAPWLPVFWLGAVFSRMTSSQLSISLPRERDDKLRALPTRATDLSDIQRANVDLMFMTEPVLTSWPLIELYDRTFCWFGRWHHADNVEFL